MRESKFSGVTVYSSTNTINVVNITFSDNKICSTQKIKEIIIDENGIKDLYVAGDGHNFENSFDIFYLSKEQAEQALLKN